MTQAEYVPGTCNIGDGEVSRRRMVALIGLIFTLSSLATSITNDASRQARLGIFIPALVMSVGWVQSRKRFCLAYGFAGTFNFGKLGAISRVSDQEARAADRKTAVKIFAQSALYAGLVTAAVVALPL
ncbi:MAG: hypothetical protein F2855_00140 [Actinobacteria bacterium]|uniref:Unannotated protein n=1 Tax=freshwater metagenome TaxID=449393 RepID=A0A6J7JZH1_9ZZZZ|nr:hypothetical protein [Actinomycetota bacterium]MTA90987.1 hypothetical protein [Actinomycetota bacterium]